MNTDDISQNSIGLAEDTSILMFDGTIKFSQDIVIGDQIMGDDSTPRTILSVEKREDDIYKISHTNDDCYFVNKNHVLSLIYTSKKSMGHEPNRHRYVVEFFDRKKVKRIFELFKYNNEDEMNLKYSMAYEFLNSIEDDRSCQISLEEYLKLGKTLMYNLKGHWSEGINFTPMEIDFDPYVIGLWLGDGTSKDAEITNQDSAILQYLAVNLQRFDCYLQYQNSSSHVYLYRINGIKSGHNPFFRVLRNNNMLNNKHIPDSYKYNSREIRMAVLAGFIDTDGSLVNGNCYEIFQAPNHKTLIDDMVFLIKSLGLRCSLGFMNRDYTYKGQTTKKPVHVIYLSGSGVEEIPTKIRRKQAKPDRTKDALVSKIKIEPQGRGDIYTFITDGNKIVLGNFIVTG
jgi:Hom_end-associated Hint